MFRFLFNAYSYCYYRLYQFYYKKWNNKTITRLLTNVIVGTPFLLNSFSLIIFIYLVFGISILPNKNVVLVLIALSAIIIIPFNWIFIGSKIDYLHKLYKEENKRKRLIKGCWVALFFVGSIMLYCGLLFYGAYKGKKEDAMHKPTINIKTKDG